MLLKSSMLEIGLTKFKPIKFSEMVSVILEKLIYSFYKKIDICFSGSVSREETPETFPRLLSCPFAQS